MQETQQSWLTPENRWQFGVLLCGIRRKSSFIPRCPASRLDRPTGGHNGGMTKHWTPLAFVYLALSFTGLIGTWTYNVFAIVQMRDFIGDVVNSGPAVSSLTVDLLIAAVAGSILIIVEARRLGMKRGWLYVALSGLTAFAFTFPLFLAMRERTLAAQQTKALD
jgi:hypothetical protein